MTNMDSVIKKISHYVKAELVSSCNAWSNFDATYTLVITERYIELKRKKEKNK